EVEEDPLADRILAAEHRLRHRLADDERAEPRMFRVEADAVLSRERAASKELDAGGRKILRVDGSLVRGQEVARLEWAAFHVVEEDVARAAQRCARHQAGGRHA